MGAIHYYEKERVFKLDTPHTSYPVSYTHLDVYKRQHQKIGKNPDNDKNDGVDDAQKLWFFHHEIQSRAFVIIFFQDNPAPEPRMAYLAGIFFVHVTL